MGFVHERDDAHAIFYAACHEHDGSREVWVDVALGEWDEALSDQVTMACRVWREGASLVTPTVAAAGRGDFFGRKLTRDEAIEHPRLEAFWAVVDHVLTNDPTVSEHFYGSSAES